MLSPSYLIVIWLLSLLFVCYVNLTWNPVSMITYFDDIESTGCTLSPFAKVHYMDYRDWTATCGLYVSYGPHICSWDVFWCSSYDTETHIHTCPSNSDAECIWTCYRHQIIFCCSFSMGYHGKISPMPLNVWDYPRVILCSHGLWNMKEAIWQNIRSDSFSSRTSYPHYHDDFMYPTSS